MNAPPVHRDSSGRSSALVAAGILVARATGVLRERALGHFLGTSVAADAFTVAFRIPNLMQHLLGEGALSASFIPTYSRLLAQGRQREAAQVASAILGLLAATAGMLTVLGILLAEPLTFVIAAGLSARPEAFALTVDLVRIMFPAVGFLLLSSWCLGVLNSHRRFFLSYVAPAVLNIVQLAVLVVLGSTVLSVSRTGSLEVSQNELVWWLAVGTVVGGLLQFLVQLPTVLRVAGRIRPSFRTDLPDVRQVLRAFAPVVAARGAVQLSAFLQLFLASFLAAGALATLRYAQVLYLLPLSLFGVSVAAAELPRLSASRPKDADVVPRMDRGAARIAAFVVPTAAGYLVVGDLLTAAVFQTGAFTRLDVVAVWLVLLGYTVGLLASTSSRLLQSGLYSIGDTRTPSRIAVIRIVFSVALGAVLMLLFDRLGVTEAGIEVVDAMPSSVEGGDVVRLGAVGLAVAGGLAGWVEYGLLRRAVHRKIGSCRLGGGQLGRIMLAAGAAGCGALAIRPLLQGLSPILAGVLALASVVVVYVPLAALLHVDAIRRATQAIWRRLRPRAKPR